MGIKEFKTQKMEVNSKRRVLIKAKKRESGKIKEENKEK